MVIHLGVYEVSDTDIEVSVMYDRAHLALGTIDEQYNLNSPRIILGVL